MRVTEKNLRKQVRSVLKEAMGVIQKKDGSRRPINYLTLAEISAMTPEQRASYGIPALDPNRVVQDRPNVRSLGPGYQLVWDIDAGRAAAATGTGTGWRTVSLVDRGA